MKRKEFANVIAWLELAIGKPICPDEPQGAALAKTQVYFDLLGDLPLPVLQAAAKRVALVHVWPSFPSVATIRRAAAEIRCGRIPPFAEVWQPALQVAKNLSDTLFSLKIFQSMTRNETSHGQNEEREKTIAGYEKTIANEISTLHPLVALAVRCFGLRELKENDVCRAQFRKVYEEVVESELERFLVPIALATESLGLTAKTPQQLSQHHDLQPIIIDKVALTNNEG